MRVFLNSLLFSLLFLNSAVSFSQEVPPPPIPPPPPPVLDEMFKATDFVAAEFPGGMKELMHFINKKMIYPEECKQKDIQGKVYVEFVVDSLGNVTKPTIKRSVYTLLDEEAIRIVKLMPVWKPATNKNVPVKQKFVMPIVFKLH